MGVRGWIPLEANPEVFSEYTKSLGVKGLVFQDIYSYEDWALKLPQIKQPVCGVIFLFPFTDRINKLRVDLAANSNVPVSNEVWFTRQTIPNACGTVALLHLLNNLDQSQQEEGTILGKIARESSGKTSRLIGKIVSNANEIKELHSKFESSGQSKASVHDLVDTHFCTFVIVDGDLYELDGQLDRPINHGKCTTETFLQEVTRIIKQNFMQLEPEDVRFASIAASYDIEN